MTTRPGRHPKTRRKTSLKAPPAHERGTCGCFFCIDEEMSPGEGPNMFDLSAGGVSYDESDELNEGEGADTWYCGECGKPERNCTC